MKPTVLVTGAAGRIGSYFAEHSHQRYDLRLMVHNNDEDAARLRAFGQVVEGDLTNLEHLKEMFQGVDAVVHMAGDPSPDATWSSLLEANISGTYHVMVAAKAAGCRRVVYASSIHAVSGYPADVQVKVEEPVNPGDLYGVSKCFGEALGRYMAEKEGLSVVALRIGAFQPESEARKPDLSILDAWVSHRDLNQIIEKSIDTPNITFAVLHALSGNRFLRLDISRTRELLGYEPQDDFTAVNPLLKDLDLKENIDTHSAITDGQPSGLREELGQLGE